MLKIEVVANALYDKHYELVRAHSDHQNYKPKLAVYMGYDFYMECMSEINGLTSSSAYEFYCNSTLMGYRVWKVLPCHHNSGTANHTAFTVVNLDV